MDEISFVLGFDVEVVNNDAVGMLIGFISIELQRSAPQRHTGKVTPSLLLRTAGVPDHCCFPSG
jgi:hypothetical protein